MHNNRNEFTHRQKSPIQIKYDAKPIINATSLKLAKAYREASIKRMENNEAFTRKGHKLCDYLNYLGFEYSCHKQKEERAHESDTHDYTRLEKYWNGNQKSEQLYKQHTSRNNITQQSQDIIPNTQRSCTHKSPKPMQIYNKESIKKTVKRMELGRIKNSANIWLQKKGFAGGKVISKMKQLKCLVP